MPEAKGQLGILRSSVLVEGAKQVSLAAGCACLYTSRSINFEYGVKVFPVGVFQRRKLKCVITRLINLYDGN
jgi:hypothetical protein